MPNKPSKQLLLFLQDKGVTTPEEIALAKREYRALYRKNWKKDALKQKEIRPTFTKEEYAFISRVAEMHGMQPTTYVRELALKGTTDIIPHRDELLLILQEIHLGCIYSMQGNKASIELLEQAEQLLIRYLNRK